MDGQMMDGQTMEAYLSYKLTNEPLAQVSKLPLIYLHMFL